jgi:hypothetical protein
MDLIGERFYTLPEEFRTMVVKRFAEDESPWIRARVVDALTSSFSGEVAGLVKEVLAKLKDDRSEEVVESILFLLLDHFPELGKTGENILSRHLGPKRPPLVRVRAAAVHMRHKVERLDELMPLLRRLAGHEDPAVRRELVQVLVDEKRVIGRKPFKDLLDIMFNDPEEDIRAAARELILGA